MQGRLSGGYHLQFGDLKRSQAKTVTCKCQKKLKNHFPLIHCNLNLLKNTWNKFLFDNELFFSSIKCFTNVWIWKKKKCRRFDYDLNLCLATFILHVRRPPEKYWHQISVFLTVNSTFIYFSHVIRVWSKMQHFISHSL